MCGTDLILYFRLPIPIRWLINLCHEWVFWQRRPANPFRVLASSIRLEREPPSVQADLLKEAKISPFSSSVQSWPRRRAALAFAELI